MNGTAGGGSLTRTANMKRNWQKRVKDIEALAGIYQRYPINPTYKPRLSKPWQPESIWKLFYRQHQAFNFSKSCKEDVHIFALEKEGQKKDIAFGQRIYLVTTHSELWFYYQMHRQSLMHCYEVIPEGSVCHLYFDLEFNKQMNPGRDGKQMVTKLIQYVCQKLEERYKIKCSVKDVLNLDSSTGEKFSRHLIFHLPNAVFKNNIHVGNCITTILQPMITVLENKCSGKDSLSFSNKDSVSTPGKRKDIEDGSENVCSKSHKTTGWETSENGNVDADLSFLIVKGRDGFDQSFVDLAVYTKNRNFRLYKSSKLGKNTSFEVAEDNQFIPKPQKNISKEELIFLNSLVSNVRFSDNLTVLTCDTSNAKKARGWISQDNAHLTVSDTVGGYHSSPYPEIDSFISNQVNKGGIQGVIRRWNYFSSEELIVYDIGKNHWCENIGRAHKNNNIMIVVDLKREIWYQKCYDHLCRAQNFKSESRPLPCECCLDFLIDMDDEFLFTMDKDGNIKASQNVECPTQNEYQYSVTQLHSSAKSTPKTGTHSGSLDAEFGNSADDVMFLEALEDAEFCIAADSIQSELSSDETEELSDNCLLAAVQQLEHVSDQTNCPEHISL
ncbi:DNA-directed primase/polymerase protein [Callorhinchus milii]|nr:DNA-directed primase/polymerase protein [Callorhinchus milii]